jgi:hypothetical protein
MRFILWLPSRLTIFLPEFGAFSSAIIGPSPARLRPRSIRVSLSDEGGFATGPVILFVNQSDAEEWRRNVKVAVHIDREDGVRSIGFRLGSPTKETTTEGESVKTEKRWGKHGVKEETFSASCSQALRDLGKNTEFYQRIPLW